MVPSEEDLVREPLLRELCLWPVAAPSAASRAANTTKSTDTGDEVPTAASPEEGGGGGVEETKGEQETLAETKEDAAKDVEDARQPEDKHRGSGGSRAGTGPNSVLGKKGGGIAARFEVLQLVNRKLRDALPYLDLNQVCFVCCVLILCDDLLNGERKTGFIVHWLDVQLCRRLD